ncbi:MAG: hypothetical protein FD167_1325 [bacterium]|nr:MAG: hypothetical protein FD167_1325 [bacterium]
MSLTITVYPNPKPVINPINPSQNPVANNSSDKGELLLGKAIEQELVGDGAHSYTLKLEANQYLNLVVEQKGIDIVATIFNPSGEKVYEVDSPNGTEGPEPIYLISQSSGNYRLEVRSLEKGANAGKYEAKLVELRTSTSNDIDRVDAFKALGEATLLRGEGKVEPAITKYQEAIKKLGETSELLAQTIALNRLGDFYHEKGDYSKAEPIFIQALDIRKKIFGDNNLDTAQSISNLAELYHEKGDYSKAEPLLIQALDIYRKILGDNNPDTASSINNLAALYGDKGDYSKAEPLYLQALNINRKVLGDNHPDTALSINNLAYYYYNKGDYPKAESFFIQALDIYRKVLGDNHPNTAHSINNLAGFYSKKGDYSKAEPLFIQALNIYRKILGDNHPTTANPINNLANIYSNKGDYSKAEPLLIQALGIRRKALGDNHPATANSLSILANLYLKKGNYTKAEPLFIQALDICRKALGDNHPDTAAAINNLAIFYYNKGDYSKAEPLFIQVLDVRRKVLGDNHPDTATSINNLVSLYLNKVAYEKAVKYSQEASDAREVELTRNLVLGSERQKQLYLQLYANEVYTTLSLHVQFAPTNPLAKQLALTQILRRKGRSIDAVNQSVEALRKRSKPEDVALLDELAGKKALFSNLSIQGLGKRSLEEYKKEIKTLQDEIEKLEYKISESSAEFRTQSQPITLQAVQQAVPSDSTLVEFASYRPYDSKTRKYAESRYVVYLLNNEGKIDWVDLGDAEAIDELVVELRGKLRNSRSSVLREIKPLSRKLDKLVMEPVRKLAGKGKRLLIAPDGTLNLVPFAALVDENGKFLLENNSISYLTSGRDLLRLQIKIDSKQQPVILADPDFGTVTEAPSPKEGETIFASLKFKRLAATEIEAKAIKTLFPNAEMLLQKQASEEALTKLNAPSILHIATHGFFLQEKAAPIPPTPDEQRLATFEGAGRTILLSIKVENPLLRSGLALSGANLRTDDKEQGIFTALKTTGLNLWGTKVVVLSACDTGVGEVKTGDGIYGLRRALVLAGSETQLMSLWPISDNGTKELMLDYYSRLQKGEGRSDALRQTQLSLLKSKTRQHPYYWASFIQSGEWANLDGKR